MPASPYIQSSKYPLIPKIVFDELKHNEKTANTLIGDFIRLYSHKEVLDSLFSLVAEEDEWLRNRLNDFLWIEINAHVEILLVILIRIIDDRSEKSLLNIVTSLEKSVTEGAISKIVKICYSKEKYPKIEPKYGSQVFRYFHFIKDYHNNKNLEFEKNYKKIVKLYENLQLNVWRDKFLSHNDRNISFLNGVFVGFYKNTDLQNLIQDLEILLDQIILVITFSEYSKNNNGLGYPVNEIHNMIKVKIQEEIAVEKSSLGLK